MRSGDARRRVSSAIAGEPDNLVRRYGDARRWKPPRSHRGENRKASTGSEIEEPDSLGILGPVPVPLRPAPRSGPIRTAKDTGRDIAGQSRRVVRGEKNQ